ncbi:MAG: ABC transporter ATP-binding protein, partial [Actinomycetia bacterium]|nr:ABC transporter ATP-binding protein [Actinomycetes bacterium]
MLVSFDDARVGYGSQAIVEHVSFSVSAGEFVGLVGPNAAGKSTLLRALTGTARVLSGSVALAGAPLSQLTPKERALLVGVVPQTPSATFAFSARAFVEMGRNPHLGPM